MMSQDSNRWLLAACSVLVGSLSPCGAPYAPYGAPDIVCRSSNESLARCESISPSTRNSLRSSSSQPSSAHIVDAIIRKLFYKVCQMPEPDGASMSTLNQRTILVDDDSILTAASILANAGVDTPAGLCQILSEDDVFGKAFKIFVESVKAYAGTTADEVDIKVVDENVRRIYHNLMMWYIVNHTDNFDVPQYIQFAEYVWHLWNDSERVRSTDALKEMSQNLKDNIKTAYQTTHRQMKNNEEPGVRTSSRKSKRRQTKIPKQEIDNSLFKINPPSKWDDLVSKDAIIKDLTDSICPAF